jgi:hypothetical protein
MSDDPLIPLPRIVGEGASGLDVFAYRRALHSMGLVPHAERGQFEANMLQGVLAFQEQANITQTGSIGKRTYALLFRHIDAFGRSELVSFARRQKVRDKMVAEQHWAIANSDQIHYPVGDDRGPNETAIALDKWRNHELPITLDCSEFAACIAAGADAPDPTGTTFGDHGPVNTGTMLSHSHAIQKHELKPGDYVILGPDPGKHACVVLSVDDPDNPVLTSHGQEKGPLQIALTDESPAHPPPVRFLSAGIK